MRSADELEVHERSQLVERDGGSGQWGKVSMTPHPGLSEQQLQDAVTSILKVEPPEESRDVPMYAAVDAYSAARAYYVLPSLVAHHPAFELDNLAPPGCFHR